jgi:hypothetical protein
MDMKTTCSTLIAAAVLLAAAAPAVAQVPGVDLKLNPRIGVYNAVSDLGEMNGRTASLDNSLAVGLGAELQFAALPFGIRANLDYATGTELGGSNQEVTPTQDATLLAVAADLVFRPLPDALPLQPYVFVGGGLKQYDFESSGVMDAGEFRDESDPTLHLGLGLDLGFGPLGLNAELGDYISWWETYTNTDETEIQHDIFLTVGFAIGLL